MPQFDQGIFLSEIFWLFFCLVFFYFFLIVNLKQQLLENLDVKKQCFVTLFKTSTSLFYSFKDAFVTYCYLLTLTTSFINVFTFNKIFEKSLNVLSSASDFSRLLINRVCYFRGLN